MAVVVAAALAVGAAAVVPSSGKGKGPLPLEALQARVCQKFASTTGSDRGPGSLKRPYRTVTRLLRSLAPGQTGCLLGGTFVDDVDVHGGGRPGEPITLRSAPRTWATLQGRVWVRETAADVVFRRLTIDGSSAKEIALQVFGDRFQLLGSEVTTWDQDRNCVILAGGVEDVVVRNDRIHDCGVPGLSQLVHGIYVQDAERAQIVGNYFYDNESGFAIHFWANGDDSLVANNVIDGNLGGIIFGGNGRAASERNTVRDNVITNSTGRGGVTSFWVGSPGEGNVIDSNCFWRNSPADLGGDGYVAANNRITDPLYVDSSAKDFRLRSDSPCAGLGPTGTVVLAPAPLGVTIRSPLNAQTVSGTVLWTVSVPAPVTRVEFYRDGNLVARLTSGPYRVSWDTTRVSNSYHTLLVRAYTSAGEIGDDQIYVRVSNASG